MRIDIQEQVVAMKFSYLVGMIVTLFTLVIGGTAWTVNLQNDIRRRLDENVTHREFIQWQEQLRRDNVGLHVPNMGTFRSGWLQHFDEKKTANY